MQEVPFRATFELTGERCFSEFRSALMLRTKIRKNNIDSLYVSREILYLLFDHPFQFKSDAMGIVLIPSHCVCQNCAADSQMIFVYFYF